MSAGKSKEGKSSIMRFYSRAAVLMSAVVGGGITIAETQKYHRETVSPGTTISADALENARPIPLPGDTAATDGNLPVVVTASAELPLPEASTDPFAVTESAWNEESDWADTDQADASPAEFSEPSPSRYSTDSDFVEPPPMLPDPVAFPQSTEPAPLADASNPYSHDVPREGSTYSDPYDRDASASDDGPQSEPELPDLDDLPNVGAAPLPEAGQVAFNAESNPTPAGYRESDEAQVAASTASDLPQPYAASATQAQDPAASLISSSPVTPSTATPRVATGSRYADPAPAPQSIDGNQASAYGVQASSSVDDGAAPSTATFEQVSDPYASQSPATPPPAASPSTYGLNSEGYERGATSAEGLSDNVQALGKPGPQSLEGPQSPSLTVQKLAPEEIQVGSPAKFEIRVRNVGRVSAENVVIRDEVPAGTKFVDSAPKASRAADGAIYWETGSLAPGQEVAIAVELMPVTEGQIGSVATVTFQASASARTRATKPDLVLEQTGPTQVLLGEQAQFSIKLTNPGSGAATQVVLEENVPQGLMHASGKRLEYEVGTIEPGQTRHLELTLKADQAGHVVNTLTARADGGLSVEESVELDVVAPELQVGIEGPKRRYIDRQATFSIAVANPGTAPARNVQLVAQLPTGLKFVSTNNSGFYDQSRHAVIWSLEQLPAGEMGKAQFTALPIEMGSFQIHAEGRAEMGLQARKEHDLAVEGIAALFFGLADKVDPIEVGGQTSYEIKVVNQGSKAATNVQFTALVPEGMQPVGGQGPTKETIDGSRITFAPLERLAPQEEAVFRMTVVGQNAGDHRFRVQMTSDETSTPVIKEESTRVYSD